MSSRKIVIRLFVFEDMIFSNSLNKKESDIDDIDESMQESVLPRGDRFAPDGITFVRLGKKLAKKQYLAFPEHSAMRHRPCSAMIELMMGLQSSCYLGRTNHKDH